MIAETTECSLRHCQLSATYRMSNTSRHLYRCPRGHTTAVKKTMLELTMEVCPGVRRTDVETSHQAAASMTEGVYSQRKEVLRVLATGPMTADQVDELIGWRLTTAGRRLPELREMGRVRMLQATGETRSGRSARLWELRR